MNIAMIPARGGSKRIPRKNVRSFAGLPMIAHAIQRARESGLFDRIVVSTDDSEIAAIAIEYEAEVPFMRPPTLADDVTPTVPVIAHGIESCESMGWQLDHVCCIYPCVPFLAIEDLQTALAQLRCAGTDYAMPIAEYPSPIQRALRLKADAGVVPFQPEFQQVRTQDLEPAYYDAGQFYWGDRSAWLKGTGLHSNTVGVPIPAWRVVDIDTPADWQRAEMLYAAGTANPRVPV